MTTITNITGDKATCITSFVAVPLQVRANMVGFSLATAPGRACYVPLRHEGTLENVIAAQIPVAEAVAALAPLLTNPAVLKIFHNAKFDQAILVHCRGRNQSLARSCESRQTSSSRAVLLNCRSDGHRQRIKVGRTLMSVE